MEGLSLVLAIREEEAHKTLDSILLVEEEIWCLKSRMLWLAARDRNTTFFHKASIQRTHANLIRRLKKQDGEWTSSLEEVNKEVVSYFLSFLLEDQRDRPEAQDELLRVIPNLVGEEQNWEMMKSITMEELENMLATMKLDESLEPDGLQVNFFMASWEIIREDLLNCCKE